MVELIGKLIGSHPCWEEILDVAREEDVCLARNCSRVHVGIVLIAAHEAWINSKVPQ